MRLTVYRSKAKQIEKDLRIKALAEIVGADLFFVPRQILVGFDLQQISPEAGQVGQGDPRAAERFQRIAEQEEFVGGRIDPFASASRPRE